MSSPTTNGLMGRWTSLPDDGGEGDIEHVTVSIGKAGVFLGITSEDGARIFHGRFVGNELEWSQPWLVPEPPTSGFGEPLVHDGVPVEDVASWADGWDEYRGKIWGIDIDRLDPMRIAVTRSYGGHFGIAVHRWNEPFFDIDSPGDTDMRFGWPMVLRGPELFTHEHSDVWQFRLTGARTTRELKLPLDTVGELGWHAGVDAAGRVVVLSAFDAFVVLTRTDAGDLRLHRHVKVPSQIGALAVSKEGHATIVLDHERGFDVVTYDRDGHELGKRTVTTPFTARTYGMYGEYGDRVVRETADGFFVFDVPSGRHVHLVGSRTEPEASLDMLEDTIVLASFDGVGIYSLTGAF